MKREPNLDHLTTLLGQCLGRIDEQAYRLQQLGDDDEDCEASDVLENEAATLQELVGSLIEQAQTPDQSDLNRILQGSVASYLGELDIPIVVRLRLAPEPTPVGCGPGQLAFAIQRALVIACGRLEVGGELTVTTRKDGDQLVLELEAHGAARDRNLQERAQTLCDFVDSFRGHCRIDVDDRGNLLVALVLPEAVAIDDC
jgi:hypothetical protein